VGSAMLQGCAVQVVDAAAALGLARHTHGAVVAPLDEGLEARRMEAVLYTRWRTNVGMSV